MMYGGQEKEDPELFAALKNQALIVSMPTNFQYRDKNDCRSN